jgi:hypothetical protein
MDPEPAIFVIDLQDAIKNLIFNGISDPSILRMGGRRGAV